MNKNLLAGAAALTLFDLSADLANAQDFTGPYAGIHAGYRWADADVTTPGFVYNAPGPNPVFPPTSQTFNLNSGIVGAHAGYTWRLGGNWLAGIEGDVTYGDGSDTKSESIICCDGVVTRTSTAEMGWQGTLRGRLGVVSGSYFFYGTAGLAFGRLKWQDTVTEIDNDLPATFVTSASKNETLTGFVVGAGAETFVTNNMMLRAEYLYEDFGNMAIPQAVGTETGKMDVTAHKLRLGLSMKF